jgi:hypothetical protein
MSSRDTMDVDRGMSAAGEKVVPELGLMGRIAVIGIVIAGALVAVPSGIAIFFIPYASVGALLAIRRPQTSIGWILLAIGWIFAILPTPIDATAEQFADMTVSWPLGLFAVVGGILPTGCCQPPMAMSMPARCWAYIQWAAQVGRASRWKDRRCAPGSKTSTWRRSTPSTERFSL